MARRHNQGRIVSNGRPWSPTVAAKWQVGALVSQAGNDFTSLGGGWTDANNVSSRTSVTGSQVLSITGFAQPSGDMLLGFDNAQNIAPAYDMDFFAYWVTGGGIAVKTTGFVDRGILIGAGSENPALPLTITYNSVAQTIAFQHNGNTLTLTSAHGVTAGMTLFAQGGFNAVGQKLLGLARSPA